MCGFLTFERYYFDRNPSAKENGGSGSLPSDDFFPASLNRLSTFYRLLQQAETHHDCINLLDE
jgi:hypothetical protein